jgi:hypothetical protein
MAVWGSGTLEDPWKVTDWDNFVSKCNETQSVISDRTYIEFPTHDQNGNLIPVEERVIDLRHHEWFVGNDAADVIIDVYRFKTIEGNGWTILGMSIRNMTLFSLKIDSDGNSKRNRNRNFEMINLNFQNIYVHGKCILFKTHYNGSRYSITGCKFSGVFDASITDIYSNYTCAITYGAINQGWNVFTACSFNFKFVSGMRIEFTSYYSSIYNSNEFNNCIFNIEGKPKPFNTSILAAGYEAGRYHLWYGTFYFCKFTGKLLLDCADSEAQETWLGTYFNVNGSLNVIDITLKKVTAQYDLFTYFYNLCYGSSNDNEVTIRYFDRSDIPDTDGFRFATRKANVFKIPADRAQMTNKDWLEDQGFVIGTAPTT